MARVKAEVEEKCLLGVDRDVVAKKADRLVDDVLAEVVPGLPRRVDVVVVIDERVGRPLVASDEDPVEAVKAPLGRPLVIRPRRAGLVQ